MGEENNFPPDTSYDADAAYDSIEVADEEPLTNNE